MSGIERLSLLQGIMRPNEEMSFSYDWLLAEDDLTTKDFISPSSYNWHPEHDDSRAVYRDRYQFGDKIGKTMYLRGIAPEMKNGLFSIATKSSHLSITFRHSWPWSAPRKRPRYFQA